MADNPPPEPSPLWAHLEAHLICTRTCQAAAHGWLIDGMSVTFPSHRPAGDEFNDVPSNTTTTTIPRQPAGYRPRA